MKKVKSIAQASAAAGAIKKGKEDEDDPIEKSLNERIKAGGIS